MAKDLREEKGEDLRKGKALGGKGGMDLNRERWQKKREKIAGGERL